MKKYDPNAIRRQARHEHELDGVHAFRVKSMTKDDGTAWEPLIDAQTGEMSCTCPDWRYRKQKSGTPCKHLAKALAQLERKGLV
jgi:hypothetical protein